MLDRKLGSQTDRARLIDIAAMPREKTTVEDVAWAIAFYRDTGAFDFAESESKRLIARAYSVIDGLPLDAEGKEVFRTISRFMIDRNT